MRGRKGSKKIRENNINTNKPQTQRISYTRNQNKQNRNNITQKKEVSRDLEKNWPGHAVNLQSNKLGF